VKDRAASQIDVAPTIADLAGVAHRTHFLGRSLVAGGSGRAVAAMVQPYDGVRIVAVEYPFKLEHHEAAEQEHLYDLSSDPDEEHDLAGDPAFAHELGSLREAVSGVWTNQALADQHRIWPAPAQVR
jgi:arylsulfatase A-like enzyme